MTHISTAGVQGFDSAGNTKHLIQGWNTLTSWMLNNRVEHRTNDLPPKWWPTQIYCHLLHPHLPVPHLELETKNSAMSTCGIKESAVLKVWIFAHQHPPSSFWRKLDWVLQPQRCFWPEPWIHTPPRRWGPPQWLSECSHWWSPVLQTEGHEFKSMPPCLTLSIKGLEWGVKPPHGSQARPCQHLTAPPGDGSISHKS